MSRRRPIYYKLHGYKQQQNTIGEWPIQLKKAVKKAVQKVALLDIETPAKQKLTIDRHILTGALRADIHTEYEGSARRDFSKRISAMDALVGTNKFYAGYVEDIDPYVTWAYKKAIPKLHKEIQKACDEFTRG